MMRRIFVYRVYFTFQRHTYYSRAVPKPPTCPIIPSAGALSHGFAIIQGR
jgi:hypothetical protein